MVKEEIIPPAITDKREYHFDPARFQEIREGIVKKLEEGSPFISPEQRFHLADKAIKDIQNEGNYSLQKGLILYGTQLAIKDYDNVMAQATH